MSAPIQYTPNFLPLPTRLFQMLWIELDWLNVAGNRLEYYANAMHQPYTYGTPPHTRTYLPQPWHEVLQFIRREAEKAAGCGFQVCFLNGYRDGKDQLGWHSDDSPEMDDARPIAIVSLGAEREIWFRPRPDSIMLEEAGVPAPPMVEKLLLGHGSLCLMAAGMQDTHQHRIPKSPLNACGPRVSLTFRGLA